MIKVYVASPYSKGDVIQNIQATITAGEELSQEGFLPYIPHLSCLWHLLYPHPVEYWYQYDMHWLEMCDCLLRLPGESHGADNEMRKMAMLGRPVFTDIRKLTEYYYHCEQAQKKRDGLDD